MIADMPKVIHALAFAHAQADPPGFPALTMLDDHVIIVPAEAHFVLRRVEVQRDQVDHAVCKLSFLSAKPHITNPAMQPAGAGA